MRLQAWTCLGDEVVGCLWLRRAENAWAAARSNAQTGGRPAAAEPPATSSERDTTAECCASTVECACRIERGEQRALALQADAEAAEAQGEEATGRARRDAAAARVQLEALQDAYATLDNMRGALQEQLELSQEQLCEERARVSELEVRSGHAHLWCHRCDVAAAVCTAVLCARARYCITLSSCVGYACMDIATPCIGRQVAFCGWCGPVARANRILVRRSLVECVQLYGVVVRWARLQAEQTVV